MAGGRHGWKDIWEVVTAVCQASRGLKRDYCRNTAPFPKPWFLPREVLPPGLTRSRGAVTWKTGGCRSVRSKWMVRTSSGPVCSPSETRRHKHNTETHTCKYCGVCSASWCLDKLVTLIFWRDAYQRKKLANKEDTASYSNKTIPIDNSKGKDPKNTIILRSHFHKMILMTVRGKRRHTTYVLLRQGWNRLLFMEIFFIQFILPVLQINILLNELSFRDDMAASIRKDFY